MNHETLGEKVAHSDRSWSIVKPRTEEPQVENADRQAEIAADKAWAEKREKYESPQLKPTKYAKVLAELDTIKPADTGDVELDKLIDREFPAIGKQAVAREAVCTPIDLRDMTIPEFETQDPSHDFTPVRDADTNQLVGLKVTEVPKQ